MIIHVPLLSIIGLVLGGITAGFLTWLLARGLARLVDSSETTELFRFFSWFLGGIMIPVGWGLLAMLL